MLFAFKRYAESACHAIRRAGGTICYVEHDSIFALFGLSGDLDRACRAALSATAEIERSLLDINDRLGKEWGCRAEISVSIHAGRVALSKLGQTAELIIAAGDAVEVATEIRKKAKALGKLYAVSNKVFSAANIAPPLQTTLSVTCDSVSESIYFMDGVDLPAEEQNLRNRVQRAMTTMVDQLRG